MKRLAVDHNDALRQRLAAWHAEGWTTRRMAEELGVHAATVGRWLRRMGLACPGCTAEVRAVLAQHVRRRARANGFRNWGHWQGQRRRVEAARLGWPAARNAGDARVLSYLAEHPDATRADLRAGQPHPRRLARSLERLQHQGLVVNDGRRPRHYRLAPGVRRHEPARRPEHHGGERRERVEREPKHVYRVVGGVEE